MGYSSSKLRHNNTNMADGVTLVEYDGIKESIIIVPTIFYPKGCVRLTREALVDQNGKIL